MGGREEMEGLRNRLVNELSLAEELLPEIENFQRGSNRTPHDFIRRVKPIFEHADYWEEYEPEP